MAEAASDAAVSHATEPMAWFRSLSIDGKHLGILQLNATQRSRLGPVVEKQVRCIQKVENFKNPPDNAAGQIFRATRWISRDDTSEGLVCLSDLQAFLATHGIEALPGVMEAVAALGAKATASMQELAKSMVTEKAALAALHKDCSSAMTQMAELPADVLGPSGFPQELMDIVAKHNSHDKKTDADMQGQEISALAGAVTRACCYHKIIALFYSVTLLLSHCCQGLRCCCGFETKVFWFQARKFRKFS